MPPVCNAPFAGSRGQTSPRTARTSEGETMCGFREGRRSSQSPKPRPVSLKNASTRHLIAYNSMRWLAGASILPHVRQNRRNRRLSYFATYCLAVGISNPFCSCDNPSWRRGLVDGFCCLLQYHPLMSSRKSAPVFIDSIGLGAPSYS